MANKHCLSAVMAAIVLLGASAATLPDDAARSTQASAYSSQGQNPEGTGDAFSYRDSESSSGPQLNGIFYDAGTKTVYAGDKAKSQWVGTYIKNGPDTGTISAIASNLDGEWVTTRGVHAISNTYQGARAVAGSNSMLGAAEGATVTAHIETYAPVYEPPTAVGDRRRSAALTNVAPKSAANSGTGNGPAAIATAWEVSSAARAGKDKKIDKIATVGHREPGDAFQAKAFGGANKRRYHRRHLLLRGKSLLTQ